MLFEEAMQAGNLKKGGPPSAEELKQIEELMLPKQLELLSLRNPERDGKTDADYLRLSFEEEDRQFMEDRERKTLTSKEQKKLPREVLTENWQEDMSLYKLKRKP